MAIRERSVRDQGEISQRSVDISERSVEIRERSVRDQGEISQRSVEISQRSVSDQ